MKAQLVYPEGANVSTPKSPKVKARGGEGEVSASSLTNSSTMEAKSGEIEGEAALIPARKSPRIKARVAKVEAELSLRTIEARAEERLKEFPRLRQVKSNKDTFLSEAVTQEAADMYDEEDAGESLRAQYEKSLEAERMQCEEKLLALRIRKWQHGMRMSEEETPQPETDRPTPAETQYMEPEGRIYSPQEVVEKRATEDQGAMSTAKAHKEKDRVEEDVTAAPLPKPRMKARPGLELETCMQPPASRLKSREAEVEADSLSRMKEEERRVPEESNLKGRVSQTQESKWMKEGDTGGSRPVFMKEISSVKVRIGEMSEFTCQFQGDPLPSVTWLKDGHPLAHNPDYEIMSKSNKSQLTIFYPTTDHEGTYDCVITNKYGKSICSSTLEISGKKTDTDSAKATLQVPQAVTHKRRYSDESFSSSPVEIRITAATPLPEMREEVSEDKTLAFTEKSPHVVSELENTSCSEGNTAVLECVITGEPAPKVTWYCDDVCLEILAGKYRVEVVDEVYRLYISSFTHADAGVYKCVARNKSKDKPLSSQVPSEVAKAPKATPCVSREPPTVSGCGLPASAAVIKFSQIKQAFESDSPVASLTSPSPEEQSKETLFPEEYIPAVAISLDQQERILEPHTMHAEVGDRLVTVRTANPGSPKAAVSSQTPVAPKPVFGKTSQTISSQEGDRKIPVISGDIEEEAVFAESHGVIKQFVEEVQESPHLVRPKAQKPTLVQQMESCEVEMVREDTVHTIDRTSRSLGLGTQEKVQGIPPAFLKPLIKKRVFENDSLTFYAEVFGLPSPEVRWFCNKTQLVADGRLKMERDGDSISLTIHSVKKADQGEYICEAVNYVGEARSVALVVVVSQEVRFMPAPPAVTHQHVMEFDVEEDDSSRSPSPQEILLEVELDEYEVKEFEKQTDSEMSEQGERYVSVNFDVFAEPAKDDKIEFKGKSSDMCSFHFQVIETSPKCVIPLTNVTAAVGTPVILQCLASGKPNPTAEWFKDGDRVTDARCIIQEKTAGHFNLLITNVSQSDAGEYRCLILNTAGCIETSALLKVF
uniref:Ig-like domain-containing protein n=1 Tax=Cyclopterus lumpus TaxID=8103 RepID=A0A8C2ZME8_CYCLU